MAAAELRGELTFCICTEIYKEPVTLICGHSFCRLCITRTWDNQEERDYSCPECRHRFSVKPELKRALSLSNIAETFRSTDTENQEQEEVRIPCTYCDSPVPANKTCLMCEASLCEKHLRKHSTSAEHVLTEPTTSLENRKCSVHKKVLEYYCCEDATCICVSCRLDGEHRGHQVETLNEASEKKKEKMRNILEKLTRKREEAEKRVQSLQELKRQMQDKAAGVTEQVTALIRDIREQLEALKKRVLGEISRQEEQVSLQVSNLIQQLEITNDELSKQLGHIEELCNLMDPVSVLQGWESHRTEYCEDTERHDLEDLDVGVILATVHSGLAGIATRVKRWPSVPEASGMSLDVNTNYDTLLVVNTTSGMLLDVKTISDMLLDVDTAGNLVGLSGDMKNIFKSKLNLRRPETPGRFRDHPRILSSKSFSSGRHYWEVEGSETGGWRFGISYPSIERRGAQSMIGNNNKSWGLGMGCINNVYYVAHDCKLVELPQPSSIQRFGIFLDYEAGRLSFYELCDPVRHLYTFTAAFTEPLHAVFGVHRSNSWVRI